MKHRVCRMQQLEESGKLAVTIEQKPIVVVRSADGSIHALRDVCPHKGPRLSDGMVDRGCHGNATGEYIYEQSAEVLRCPWHSWEFDIRTGRSLFDPEKVRVKTYDVTVDGDDVYVEL